MATAPVKSQPLHNFSLPFLKWGHKNQVNNGNNHRLHRLHEQKPPQTTGYNSPGLCQRQNEDRLSPSEPESESELENRSKLLVGSRTPRHRFSFASCSSQKQQLQPQPEQQPQNGVVEGERKEDGDVEESERDECGGKPWNLRPRKVVKKVGVEAGTASSKNGELLWSESNMQTMRRLRGFSAGQDERKEKTKLWISLSREEIEEDLYAFTGAKPARRPKKRPKTIQKHVDNVFPGLYLIGVTADSYRVHDALVKRLM